MSDAARGVRVYGEGRRERHAGREVGRMERETRGEIEPHDTRPEIMRAAAEGRLQREDVPPATTFEFESPLRPEQVTVGRLEKEMGETPDLTVAPANRDDKPDQAMTQDEREAQGMAEEDRDYGSLGRR